jgi:hypothetical protein
MNLVLVFYECVRVGRFAMKDVERDTIEIWKRGRHLYFDYIGLQLYIMKIFMV